MLLSWGWANVEFSEYFNLIGFGKVGVRLFRSFLWFPYQHQHILNKTQKVTVVNNELFVFLVRLLDSYCG